MDKRPAEDDLELPPPTRRRVGPPPETSGPPLDPALLSSLAAQGPLHSTIKLAQWAKILTRRSESSSHSAAAVAPPSSVVRGVVGKGKGKATAPDSDNLDQVDDAPNPSGDGSVVLSRAEVEHLVGAIDECLDSPASKRDLVSLFSTLFKPQAAAPSSPALLPVARLPSPAAPLLPTDIIRLIVDELRLVHEFSPPDEALILGLTASYVGWRELRNLSLVSRAWHSVAGPLLASEFHIHETRQFPLVAKRLLSNPIRAILLTKLHIRVFDFEGSYGRGSDDAGFSLPDILARSPNLRTLELSSSRPSGRPGRVPIDANAFAGTHLPSAIISSLPALRTLIYGVSCTLADVQLFITSLPDLCSLDVTGDVDPVAVSSFTACPPQLRRLWLPNVSLTTSHLRRLLSSSTSRVSSLAFQFDLDDTFSGTPPTPEAIESAKTKLLSLFQKIGPRLRELLINTPFADFPDGGSRLRLPGGVGGAIQIAFQTFTHVAGMGPQPTGPPMNLNGPPPPAGGARRAGPPPPPPTAGPIPVVAAGGPGGAVAMGPFFPAAVAGGGGAGAPIGGPPPAPPATGASPAAGGPAALRPARTPRPPGVPVGGGPPGGHFRLFNPFAAPVPAAAPTPFFEPLISLCPSLAHLELYGRRYSASLVDVLVTMPLEYLGLSVPVDEERGKVVEGLVKALGEGMGEGEEREDGTAGMWRGMRRVELSGRGGEWEPAERRRIKEACERRGVVYSSAVW